MIFGGRNSEPGAIDALTLDDMFRRICARSPGTLALIDPPNRAQFTDGVPRQLTYAEADRAISALARQLRALGLQTDAVVALQLPNTVESVVAFIAVLRAGMIAAPLPLLWRKQEIAEALRRVSAQAIVTASRIGTVAHAEIASQAAAEVFSVRFVGGFGLSLPDGVLPLNPVFAAELGRDVPSNLRIVSPALHVATVTFEPAADGLAPVARNHVQLTAAGLAVFPEGQDYGPLLSAVPLSSLAGLSLSVMPWLLHGGTLALHHPFGREAFVQQCSAHGGSIALPAAALTPLADAGCLDDAKMVFALWRSPERIPDAARWTGKAALVDVACFGEVGLIAAGREPDGVAGPTPCRIADPPYAAATDGLEATRTAAGTLALRGAMVPFVPQTPSRHSEPHLYADAAGFVETGIGCRFDRDGQTLTITGPPAGTTTVGGYRFRQAQVEAAVAAVDPAAAIFALPDAMLGQRLAASAANPAADAAGLQSLGINPLITRAFLRHGLTQAA
jgi:hypothetical protein